MALVKLRTQLVLIINTVDPVILARGRNEHLPILKAEVFQQGDSHWVKLNVQGSEEYSVQLGETRKNSQCSCPYFARNQQTCKHMIAAALHSMRLLKNMEESSLHKLEAPKKYIPGLEDLLQSISSSSKDRLRTKAALLAIPPLAYYYTINFVDGQFSEWSLLPLLGDWDGEQLQNVKRLSMHDLRRNLNRTLGTLDKALLEMTPTAFRSFESETPYQVPFLLSIFRDYPKLLHPQTYRPIHIEFGYWQLRLLLEEIDNGYQLKSRLLQGNEIRTWNQESVTILGGPDKCILVGHTLYALDQGLWKDSELSLLLNPIPVPQEQLNATVRKLRERSEYVDIPEKYLPKVVPSIPRPILMLSWIPSREELHAILLFQYNPAESLCVKSNGEREFIAQDADGNDVVIQRRPDLEEDDYAAVCLLMRNEIPGKH